MKVGTEGNHSDYAESVASQQGNRGRFESMKKLKKVRSIRLVRLPSKRSSTRGGRHQYQYDNLSILSSVDTESLEAPTPIEMADASPNYMKATSSSHAKDSFQNIQRLFTKKTLTRMSTTLKLKRSLTRKLSGRTEPKRILKSLRSIKLATHGSDDKNWKSASDAGNKPQRVITRRLSLKPVRILTKMATFKSKNSPMERDSGISQSPDTSLLRATCSSALKDSHFADHIDLPQEGSDCQASSAVKVCPYSYCSLHGHRHANHPPLKRFVSMRRRALKSHKLTKMDRQPVTGSKQIGSAKKAAQKTQTVHSEDGRSNLQKKKKPARDLCISPHGIPVSTVTAVTNTSNKGKNMEQDYEVLKMSSVQKEHTDVSITDMASGMQEGDKKYMTMWQLVYKHAVLSNTVKCENKVPFDGKDKERREQDSLAINEVNNSSCYDDCDTDQHMDDENKNAVELVQKAFDEILLPEPEDLFSDDHSKSEGVDSDEVLSEKSECDGERNASTSTESQKTQIMGTKSDQRTPKSWSNLKKLILLRRFVKALEKVRNITPQRPRLFPPDANLDIERVFLKHQTTEEKKNAEEWMLDFALQKVISKLEPAQRQRVTLLIEAFQTILPFQDAESGPRFSATMKPQANPIQPLDNSSNDIKEEASFSHDSTTEQADNAGDDPMPDLRNPIVLEERCLEITGTETVKNMPEFEATEEDLNGKQSLAGNYDYSQKISSENDNIYLGEIKDTRSSSLNEPVESCHEEAPAANEIVNDVPQGLLSNVNTESPHIKSESPGRDVETKNLIGDNSEQISMSKSLILEGLVRSLRSNLIGSGAPSNLPDEPTAGRKEGIEKVQPETGTLVEFPTKEQSEAPMSAVVEPETPVQTQNTGLWYLVYKHMVSNMAENNSKSLIDGEDDKESGFDESRTRRTSISYGSTPATDQDMHIKDHVVADPEVQQQQIEAIKMVEEAIDSIIPDDQDDLADKESLTDNTISDNSKQSDRTERVYSLNQKEDKMESGNGMIQAQQEESAPKEGNKTNQQLSRSWSNLKKVILLRRFIKALEKVRKFNPRGPRYLPLEPDSEAEKVNLRHQDMEERKGTEEWMLDYALRQVVSKLTPARKRKVELLVEAFETVIPTI